jgi:hypothetical protein
MSAHPMRYVNSCDTVIAPIHILTCIICQLYWVGQAAQVNKIVLDSEEDDIVPNKYKAVLSTDGESGTEIVTDSVTLSPDDVTEIDLSPTFFNVPVEYVDAATVTKTLNPNFGASIKGLFEAYPSEAVIFSCRSGNRSTIGCYVWYCSEFLDPSLSMGKTFYEVEAWAGDDRKAEINGKGVSLVLHINVIPRKPLTVTSTDSFLQVDLKELLLAIPS